MSYKTHIFLQKYLVVIIFMFMLMKAQAQTGQSIEPLPLNHIVNGTKTQNFTLSITEPDVYTIQVNHAGICELHLIRPDIIELNNITYQQVYPFEWSSYTTILEHKFRLTSLSNDYHLQIISDSFFTLKVMREYVKFIEPNKAIFGLLSGKMSQKYHVVLKKGQYFQIEIIDCLGSSEINSKYKGEIQLQKQDDEHLFEIKAKGLVPLTDKEDGILYNLVAHVYDHQEIQNQQYKYDYEIGTNEINFNIHPVQYGGQPALIQYTVHATNIKEYINAFGGCSMDNQQVGNYQQLQNQLYHDNITYVVDTSKDNNQQLIQLSLQSPEEQSIFVIIQCQIYYQNPIENYSPRTYLYEVKKIHLTKQSIFVNKYLNSILIGVSIISLIFLILMIIRHFRRKYLIVKIKKPKKLKDDEEMMRNYSNINE